MKFCFEIGLNKGEKPKPKPPKRWYVETYEINGIPQPRYIVTDRNMYCKGYIQAGRVGDCKRWELKESYMRTDRILVEVRKK